MAERIIELTWKCKDCGQTNLGRHKRCPSCGSPREKAEMKMPGLESSSYDSRGRNKAATVTDPELLKLAKAGADWFCTHCEAGNMGTGDRCSSCGGPRYGQKEESLRGQSEERRREPVPRAPPNRRTVPQSARAPISYPVDGDGPIHVEPDRTFVFAGVGAGMVVLLLIGFLIWAFQTHDTGGKVTATQWEQSVEVERWTDVIERRWRRETHEGREIKPVNGKGERPGMVLIGGCRSEHFADERYVCGSHRECSPKYRSESYDCGETCTSNDNGFATCRTKYCTRSVPDGETCRDVTDYCTRPIYETKCDYETQEWRHLKGYPKAGSDLNTQWAEPTLGELDRKYFTAAYKVTIAYGKKAHTFNPTSTEGMLWGRDRLSWEQAQGAEREYRRWAIGSPVTLTINNLGGIREVKLATPEAVAAGT